MIVRGYARAKDPHEVRVSFMKGNYTGALNGKG